LRLWRTAEHARADPACGLASPGGSDPSLGIRPPARTSADYPRNDYSRNAQPWERLHK